MRRRPGPRYGRMPMLSLAAGLRGQALLIERVNDLLYGDGVTIRVEVDPDFETGSFVIPVHIFFDAVGIAKHALTSESATALANLVQFLGFGGISGISIYQLFRKLKGRRIEKPENLPVDLKTLLSPSLRS